MKNTLFLLLLLLCNLATSCSSDDSSNQQEEIRNEVREEITFPPEATSVRVRIEPNDGYFYNVDTNLWEVDHIAYAWNSINDDNGLTVEKYIFDEDKNTFIECDGYSGKTGEHIQNLNPTTVIYEFLQENTILLEHSIVFVNKFYLKATPK